MDSWLYRLQPASFRGVPFKVTDDTATLGRRSVVHEYPLRDIPYTDDLGRKARKYAVSAYVIGNDYMAQRDRLLAALELPGPGTLIHPCYGTLRVNVNGDIQVKHSQDSGGMCTIMLTFVESGMLFYPTEGGATEQNAKGAADKADESFISHFLKTFEHYLDEAEDWVVDNVINNVSAMLDQVISVFDVVDSAIADAARLLQGDLSALFPPPSKGGAFVQQVEAMWSAGKSVYYNTGSAISAVDNLKYIVSEPALAPKGVWPTLSASQQSVVACTNMCSQLLRSTALTQSVRQFTSLPAPDDGRFSSTGMSTAQTHPAITMTPGLQSSARTVLPVSYDQLSRQQLSYNAAFDQELNRIMGDEAFVQMENLRQAVFLDIRNRLQRTTQMMTRTPDEVTPAVVLASDWYDDAARGTEIVAWNTLPHPGFVPPEPIRVAIK